MVAIDAAMSAGEFVAPVVVLVVLVVLRIVAMSVVAEHVRCTSRLQGYVGVGNWQLFLGGGDERVDYVRALGDENERLLRFGNLQRDCLGDDFPLRPQCLNRG